MPIFPQHWVQSDKLVEVMREIVRHAARSWPADTPDDPEDFDPKAAERAFADAMVLSDALAQTAQHIPESVAHVPMTEADRAAFAAQAQILRDQARRLKVAARRREIEQMQRTLDAIHATCVACHGRFRDFSGELTPRHVSRDEWADGVARR